MSVFFPRLMSVCRHNTMNSPMKSQKGRDAAAATAASDGGYAWFVLLSCFLVFGLSFGVIKAFGVFYVEIHQYFETTATGTSWITSIAVATIHVVGNQTLPESLQKSWKCFLLPPGGSLLPPEMWFGFRTLLENKRGFCDSRM